jgi:hypothetical protein
MAVWSVLRTFQSGFLETSVLPVIRPEPTGHRIISQMSWRKSFFNWVLLFAALGIVVPLLLLIRFFIFRSSFGTVESWLWPSSLTFMALDAPGTPVSTVVAIYAVALAENALLYAVLGAVIWPFAYVARRKG